jgi:hypothetical protein
MRSKVGYTFLFIINPTLIILFQNFSFSPQMNTHPKAKAVPPAEVKKALPVAATQIVEQKQKSH